jgi:hypothetical protein
LPHLRNNTRGKVCLTYETTPQARIASLMKLQQARIAKFCKFVCKSWQVETFGIGTHFLFKKLILKIFVKFYLWKILNNLQQNK